MASIYSIYKRAMLLCGRKCIYFESVLDWIKSLIKLIIVSQLVKKQIQTFFDETNPYCIRHFLSQSFGMKHTYILETAVNTLRPRQNGRHFPDDIFKCIFFNENASISIKIKKFVPKGSISNIPALVQIMAWRRPGDKPLSEPMMVSLLTHICVTRPQ